MIASSSGILTRVIEEEIKNFFQSLQLADPKKNNPHTLVQVGSRLVIIPCTWNQDKCVTEQQDAPQTRCK